MPITAFDGLTPPSTDNPANFDTRADAFLSAFQTFQTQVNALEKDLNDLISAVFTTSSTTSLSIGTGTKTLTVQTGLGYAVGQTAIIARTSDASKLMVGKVTAYDKTSGSLSVSVPPGGAYGSGTYTDWTVSLGPAGNAPVVRGHIDGLTLSTAGSSATFSVAAGECADSTNAVTIQLASAISKTTSAWASGTGNGGLDTGSIANSTWYHAFLIYNPTTGATDALVSTSESSPTLPTGYTYFRRIGAMKTDGSGKWVKFTQNGDEFLWDAPPSTPDVNGTVIGLTSTLFTLSVPPGVNVTAKVNAAATNTGAVVVLIQSPDQSTQVANTPTGNFSFTAPGGSNFGATPLDVRTNKSGQIRAVANSGSTTLYVNTQGWVDGRGQDA